MRIRSQCGRPAWIALASALTILACGSSASDGSGTTGGGDGGAGGDGALGDGASGGDGGSGEGGTSSDSVIFVIPMENKAQAAIYGDMTDAPYINNTLLKNYAHTINFTDELPALVSEPHYIWMESGTNAFSDYNFIGDGDSAPGNSTNSTEHLSTQLDTAGISWTSYQQGITAGSCPVASIKANFYAAKHDPFVFFQDVAGSPPDSGNARCASHHKPLTSLSDDLKNGTAARYNFITPDLCHDMHGDTKCSQGASDPPNIKAGDDWLSANLQPIIDYALAHDGYVFITWDEGDSTNLIPFIAIGKNSIAMHEGSVAYTHSSLLKSEEEIFGLPILSTVTTANDFADLFTSFP